MEGIKQLLSLSEGILSNGFLVSLYCHRELYTVASYQWKSVFQASTHCPDMIPSLTLQISESQPSSWPILMS